MGWRDPCQFQGAVGGPAVAAVRSADGTGEGHRGDGGGGHGRSVRRGRICNQGGGGRGGRGTKLGRKALSWRVPPAPPAPPPRPSPGGGGCKTRRLRVGTR